MIRQAVETIVALTSGSPPSAVAVIRLSGPEAFEIARQVFAPWPAQPETRRAIYGQFLHGDDGLALPFLDGTGFTGEPCVEFSIHGSRASINGLLEACLRAGARTAKPGEFTQRAFLNGKLDLAQAEAVADIIASETSAQLKASHALAQGSLSRPIGQLRDQCLDLLAEIEARIDFSEELGDLDFPRMAQAAQQLIQNIEHLLNQSATAQLARDGIRIAIVGPPNAGKSTLLNALVGFERAIVTPIAGTTRDTVEEAADIGGVRVHLIDTAGLRDSEDLVERLGVERSRQAIGQAHLVWFVYDAAEGWTPAVQALFETIPTDAPITLIANKSDLPNASSKPTQDPLAISAQEKTGLHALVQAVQATVGTDLTIPYLNQRQKPHLEAASRVLIELATAIDLQQPPDLLSVLLRDAVEQLGEILGLDPATDILDQIFSRFCIGK